MTLRTGPQHQVVSVSFTTSSSDLTDAIQQDGYRLGSVIINGASSDWDAANLTFQGSVDNATFRNLYTDTGGELTVVGTAAAANAIGVTLAPILGAQRYIKLRSGTSGTAVSQTVARTLTLVLVPDKT